MKLLSESFVLQMVWPGGTPPADVPNCGFEGELCSGDEAKGIFPLAVHVNESNCFTTTAGQAMSVVVTVSV